MCELNYNFFLVSSLRMCGAILSLPQYVFMARYLAKHRDNFTFTGQGFCEHGNKYSGSKKKAEDC